MFQPHGGSPGGHFKALAQSQQFAHGHASQMAHSAANRLRAARALSGGGSPAPSPQPPMAAPGGAPMGAPGGGNFKVGIAQMAGAHGMPVSVNHVHRAIGSLAQKGAFTPFQAQSLVQHNGPLQGPQGVRTSAMIAHELATNPQTRMGP